MHRLFTRAALIAAPWMLLGCSSSTDTGTTPPDPPKKHAAMFACDESDFVPLSFGGQEFDKKTGKFTGAPQETYLVHTTWLKVRADEQKRFSELNGPVFERLQTQTGLLGYSVGTSEKCGTARTMGVWRDQASVSDFVTSKEHAAAMAEVGSIAEDYATDLEEQRLDGAPPTWAQVIDMLATSVEAE